MATPRITFTMLIESLRDTQRDSQGLRNRLSAVRQLARLRNRSMLDCAHAELVTALDQTLRTIDCCKELSVSRRRDLRSHARWLSTYLTTDTQAPRQVNRPAPRPDSAFTKCLRSAFHASGLSKSHVADAAGMSPATFGEWLMGRQPRSETIPKLHLVEQALGLKGGELSQHVCRMQIGDVTDPCIAYRRGVTERQQDRYRADVNKLPRSFVSEWREFLEARTSGPIHSSMPKSGWSLKPAEKGRTTPNALNSIDGMVSASADVIARHVLGVVGWLTLTKEKGGRGLAMSEINTIAWLAVPDVVDGYLNFLLSRSGRVNNAHTNYAGFVSSVCSTPHGYFWNHPERLAGLPVSAGTAQRTPSSLLEESLKTAQGWRARYTGRSRDPKLPLRMFSDENGDMLAPLWKGVQAIDAAATKYPYQSPLRACKARDALMLALLLAIPMRCTTLATLRIGSHAEDVIYKSGDSYRLRLGNVKNIRSAEGQGIDIPLPKFLGERVREYLEQHRPVLLGSFHSDFFLLSRRNPHKPWATLNSQVITLTKLYVPGCPGVGPHAFRHAVASMYLRKHRGEYATVARLLMVDLQTVMTHYDQNSEDYAFELHAADVEKIFRELSKRN